MMRLLLYLFFCSVHCAAQDSQPKTMQVGELGKVGHVLFHANDGQFYEYGDEDLIGAGAWARVYRARRLGNVSQMIAVKYTLFQSPFMGGNEIEVLTTLGRFRGRHNNTVGMVYHQAQTLGKLLASGTLSKHELDVLCALSEVRVQEFHRITGFVHRDLKPDNMLVTKNLDIILIDFSLAEPIIGDFTREEALSLMEVDSERPCFEIRKSSKQEYRRQDHAHILLNGKPPVDIRTETQAIYDMLRLRHWRRDLETKLQTQEKWRRDRLQMEDQLYL